MKLSTHKADASEQKRNEKRLQQLLKLTANTKCSECTAALEFRTAWASINLGVFFCDKCAGIHRSLGTHLSRVKSVAADDWNDDWVDQMERWGNERATLFWEARVPPQRPTPGDGVSQSHLLKEFIKAKYDERRAFSSDGDPADWLVAPRLELENGWVRFLDENGQFYYYCEANPGETTWVMPEAARAACTSQLMLQPGRQGWLHKKSGGKEDKVKLKLLQKWDRRFFVLPPNSSELRYYKSEDDYRTKGEPLGSVQCVGGSVFLKLVTKDAEYRFTVRTRERELKLRAQNSADYEAWVAALKPVLGGCDDAPSPPVDDGDSD
mmetsp:Transcript_5818/g.9772  ORF Transcript_5818/g.9772 Transcript_5818/m.9772 type:complete len:323 (+) Transcript_5818:244-1212(+)|eukprot:CAMPEP_0119345252 /NCGR_PEP_ID=MMETSP1333-20130426/107389_1 /TAXON_ID=418940 /ORGANISM="Scyphosphaera apsteinii, Strain RCC1455" /LENGTH=322 /DNA_ID=CAMNT_0007357711 /DNA_START=236 /DNA_END=1204 /DNA_ORIENTATION=+